LANSNNIPTADVASRKPLHNHPPLPVFTPPVALIKVHTIANNNNNNNHNNNVGRARAKIAREYFAFVFYLC